MLEDYLPRNWDEFNGWIQNFAQQLPKFTAKYGISAANLTALDADAAWTAYWTQARTNARQQQKQLTDYTDDIAKKPIGSAAPSEPTWELPPNAPAPRPPGIRKRIRQIAAFIKNNPAYDEADGELLGIVGTDSGEPDALTARPTLTVRTLPAFALEVEYKKLEMDALSIELRRTSGARADWEAIKVLTRSSGSFTVEPMVAGQGEQIELRAVYLKNDSPFGNYSDTVTAFIAP